MVRDVVRAGALCAALALSGCAAHLLPVADGATRRAGAAKVRIEQPLCIAPIRFLTAPANNYSHSVYQIQDALNTKCSITGAPVDEELRAMLASSLTKQFDSEISAEIPPVPLSTSMVNRSRCARDGIRIQAALLSFDCGSELADGTVWLPLMIYSQRTVYSPISIELAVNVIDERSDRVLHSFTAVGEFEQTLSESTYPFGLLRYKTLGGAPISEAFRQALDRAAEEIARWSAEGL